MYKLQQPADPKRLELEQIKQRQKQRKQEGKPAKVANDILYEMLSDVLENQARFENMLKKLTSY